jgi:AcrR family transcriptional regulator
MKTKTEAKRLAIIKAAGEVFREMGYERASMSKISARVGGSKETLYNYFPSKEKLFFEVMYHAKEVELEATTGALNPEAHDLKKELLSFGRKFLTILYSQDTIAIRRLTIAESRHTAIGKMSIERTYAPIENQVAVFLKNAMKHGRLRTADPGKAAIHLLSLLESELLQRALLGMIDSVKPGALTGPVRRAVEVFLSGYGQH